MKGAALLVIMCLSQATSVKVPQMQPNDDTFNDGEWVRTNLGSSASLSSSPECKIWASTCSEGKDKFKEQIKILYDQLGVDQLFGDAEGNQPDGISTNLKYKQARTAKTSSRKYDFVYYFQNNATTPQTLGQTYAVKFYRTKNSYGEWTGDVKVTDYYKYYWQGPWKGFTTSRYMNKKFDDNEFPLELGWMHAEPGSEEYFKGNTALNKVTKNSNTQLIAGDLQNNLEPGIVKECWYLPVNMGKYWMIKSDSIADSKSQSFWQIYEIGDQAQLIYTGSLMPSGEFAKYMPKDLTEDFGKNPELGWSKKLMINQWDHTTIEKVIKQNPMLKGKIPLQKQIKSNAGGAQPDGAGGVGSGTDVTVFQKFKNALGDKLEDFQSVTANVSYKNLIVTATTPYWKMYMGDLLPKTINEDVTGIAQDLLYLKTGFKVGDDHEEFNNILNKVGAKMKSMYGQVGPKPLVLEWQVQDGEQEVTYDAHMISPYDHSNPNCRNHVCTDMPTNESCFWMKFSYWKADGKAKIVSAWGYTDGVGQALQRLPKWKGTLQMNGSGKGAKENWKEEMTASKQGLVPTGRPDPLAQDSAHALVAAMILLNLLF